MAGMLRVTLIGTPPMVELERDAGVDDNFWFGLPVQIAPGQAATNGRQRFAVPLERFLSSRRWLRQTCLDHHVGLDFDEEMLAILARARAEREAISRHLASGEAEPDVSVAQALVAASGSRYTRDLRQFQLRDLAKLLTLEHGSNFSVPGAGKTAVAYGLYEAERLRGRVDRLMIVAPLSAYEAWETEADRCFSEPPFIHRFSDRIPHGPEVVLVNYQRLTNYLPRLAGWLHEGNAHLILDEAHRMKRGRGGQWGSACLDLAQLALRRDILTGTPAPQGPRDFIALLDFVWPDQARRILPRSALLNDPPIEAIGDVSDSIGSLFVRTTKSELGLEPPHLHVETVSMKPLQTDIYDALRNRYVGLLDLSHTDQTMLAQMGEVTMYLLEAATNPALLARRVGGEDPVALRYPMLSIPPGSQLSDLIARYSDHELPPKFEKLAALIEANTAAGRKTLVWSNFVGNLLYLERLLARYQPALIYGAIPSDDGEELSGVRTRSSELGRFRGRRSLHRFARQPGGDGRGRQPP